jgi:hypothetical protein
MSLLSFLFDIIRSQSTNQLSMISMADHCTRRIYHGTPIHEEGSITAAQGQLPQPAPIVGLLFGTIAEQKPPPPSHHPQPSVTVASAAAAGTAPTATHTAIVNISDAEDVPILFKNSANAASTAIELHQAVYTDHIVVGWYRVNLLPSSSSSDEGNEDTAQLPQQQQPTADDLLLSQQLSQQYASNSSPFIFALLHVPVPSPSMDVTVRDDNRHQKMAADHAAIATASLAEMLANNKNMNDDKNSNDDIPLSLYIVDTQEKVLIGLDYYSTVVNGTNRSGPSPMNISAEGSNNDSYSWKLVTAPYERISVETIMQHDGNSKNCQSDVSAVQRSASKVQLSLFAIYERLDTLECTLQRLLTNTNTTENTDASTLSLLRHVNSLLLHVSTMSSIITAATPKTEVTPLDTKEPTNTVDPNSATNAMLQQLVILSETISTIQQYTDKLHIVQKYNQDLKAPNVITKNSTTSKAMSSGSSGNRSNFDMASRQHTRSQFPMFE